MMETYLLSFGLLLIGVRERLLFGLQCGFGEKLFKLHGVNDVWLLQRTPQCVIAGKEAHNSGAYSISSTIRETASDSKDTLYPLEIPKLTVLSQLRTMFLICFVLLSWTKLYEVSSESKEKKFSRCF